MADFWTTAAGILLRLAFLADDIESGEFNEAIVTIATSKLRDAEFTMTGPEINFPLPDDQTCDFCAPFLGKSFRLGDFPIDLPAHNRCRHWWSVVPVGVA